MAQGTVKSLVSSLNNNLANAVKCVKKNVSLNSTGEWSVWPEQAGYGGYQLIKAFTSTWNTVTVINENAGFWHVKVEGLSNTNVDMFFIIVYAPIPQ